MGGKKSKASDQAFALENKISLSKQPPLEVQAKTRSQSMHNQRKAVQPQSSQQPQNQPNVPVNYHNSNEWNVPAQLQQQHYPQLNPPQYYNQPQFQQPQFVPPQQIYGQQMNQPLSQQQMLLQQQMVLMQQYQQKPNQQQNRQQQQQQQQRPQQQQQQQIPAQANQQRQQQQHVVSQNNQRPPNNQSRIRHPEYGSEVDSQDDEFQDAINEAIIQSIFEQDTNEEEEKMLREVMKISSFEHQKQTGLLSLDHLKKKNQKQDPQSSNAQQQQQLLPNINSIPKVNPNDLPPVEIGGKKKNIILGGNQDISMSLVNNSDLQKQNKQLEPLKKQEPQNTRDQSKLNESVFDKKAQDDLKKQKELREIEEARLMQILTPALDDHEEEKHAANTSKIKTPDKSGAKRKLSEEFGDFSESPQKSKKSQKKHENKIRNETSQLNGFEDLLDDSLDLSISASSPQKIDKDKLKQIMDKKKLLKEGVQSEIIINDKNGASADLHKGNPNSIFYDNDDTKASIKPQNVLSNPKIEDESEDEFDKLIGKIEKGGEDKHQHNRVIKHDDVEEEDFF